MLLKRLFTIFAILGGIVVLGVIINTIISSNLISSPEGFITGNKTATTTSVEHTSPLAMDSSNSQVTKDIRTPGGVVHALISDTDPLRQKGLSDRVGLANDQGMLFIFDAPATYGFWMKDMHFAIDMVWIGADYIVKGISRNALPDSYPQSFFPPSSIQYVLELPAGDATRFKIATGTILSF